MAEPRDDKVSAAFRAMPPLEPPRALDDAIRAAARRAVKAKPETPLRRWAIPASVAAVLALSIGIALHVDWQKPLVVDGTPVPSGGGEYPVTQAPAEPAAKEQAPPAAPNAKDAEFAKAAPAPKAILAESTAESREVKREKAVVPMESPPPAPAAVPPPAPSVAPVAAPMAPPPSPPTVAATAPPPAALSQPAQASGNVAAPAAARVAPAAPPAAVMADRARDEAAPQRAKREAAGASVAKEAVALTPEKQLERIAELRAAGRHAEADEALAKFRRDYPDYRIAPELWEKVKPR
jgi:hypothetical protein